MLEKNGHLKLIDLGIASVLGDLRESMHSIAGSYAYMAPEIQSKTYDYRIDWYSFGILLFELSCPSIFQHRIACIVHQDEKLQQKIRNVPLRKLIRKLCAPAKLRLHDAEKIRKEEFFNEIDWDKIEDNSALPPFIPVLKNGKLKKEN